MPKLKVFLKSQFSGFIGGVIDFIVMLLMTEIFGWHYVNGIILGAIIGAIVNYYINRRWAFKAREEAVQSQLFKFFLVACGSLILKCLGTYSLTEYVAVDYRIARLIMDLMVSWCFNFVLMYFWVFKTKPAVA